MKTIFDYLPAEDRFEGNELFEDLVANWNVADLSAKELFQIGFARGRNVVVPMNEPDAEKASPAADKMSVGS